MFKTIDEARDIVMARKNQTYGIDYLNQALDSLGKPQDKLKIIHIGGTNGKGSTTNFTRSILQEAGYKVGTFTSPHLLVHNDRIRVQNEPISDEDLLRYINWTYPLWEKFHLSMFEIDMILSIQYFIDMEVDYVVYEVGLGGRLDATNVVTPLVSGITNVGLDHQNILGNTIQEIAKEKAGIIKPSVPIITTSQDIEVLDIFVEVSTALESPFRQICIPYYHTVGKSYVFDYLDMTLTLTNQGAYQVSNAVLAISLVNEILPNLDHNIYIRGIASTHWAGRFEEISENIYIDGAHNEMGIAQLINSIQILPKPWTIVFTALRDKDFSGMLDTLISNADKVIVTEFDFYRAASLEELSKGKNVIAIRDPFEAIDFGLESKGEGSLIVTGSLYFISEVREYLKKRTISD